MNQLFGLQHRRDRHLGIPKYLSLWLLNQIPNGTMVHWYVCTSLGLFLVILVNFTRNTYFHKACEVLFLASMIKPIRGTVLTIYRKNRPSDRFNHTCKKKNFASLVEICIAGKIYKNN